jgi:acetyl-CoA carboxylase biotin carboxyl carrier protein
LDLKEIKELIALMRKNDLSVFKMESEGFKITLKKGNDFQPVIHHVAPVAAPVATASAAAAPAPAAAAPATNLKDIASPMVGTYYGSPSPDAQPFVKIGQDVDENSVVCIIEAMKVMNEIKADARGTIAEVVAENGKPVQFGQALFRIVPK